MQSNSSRSGKIKNSKVLLLQCCCFCWLFSVKTTEKEKHSLQLAPKSEITNLDICTVRCHELFINERTGLPDFTDRAVDTTATSYLLHVTAMGNTHPLISMQWLQWPTDMSTETLLAHWAPVRLYKTPHLLISLSLKFLAHTTYIKTWGTVTAYEMYKSHFKKS